MQQLSCHCHLSTPSPYERGTEVQEKKKEHLYFKDLNALFYDEADSVPFIGQLLSLTLEEYDACVLKEIGIS